jgi:hypothetical protein
MQQINAGFLADLAKNSHEAAARLFAPITLDSLPHAAHRISSAFPRFYHEGHTYDRAANHEYFDVGSTV